VHPSWAVLHYPAYWHYDVLQGLRLLAELDLLYDPRAADAIAELAQAQRASGFSGRTWASQRQRPAIERGASPSNRMLNHLASIILRQAAQPAGSERAPSGSR
jgi:hypothetical protein